MAVRLAAFLTIPLVLALTACSRPTSSTSTPIPVPPPSPVPVPPPPPPPYVPSKRLDTGRIFNGFQYKVTLETEHGSTASIEREIPSSYAAELQIKVKVPKPNKDLAEISRLNDKLPTVLPDLALLLDKASISPAYDDLYRLKVAILQQSLNRLDNLLTRHNFFDCETILDFQHPHTKRRAVFIQSDMDTDTDGSDSDRVPETDGSSVTFQPFTSYKWPKKSVTPNTFITPRESRLKAIEQELAANNASPARTKELKETQSRLKGEISDLKKYSYLVAAVDPFVVLPASMVGKKNPFSPVVGDYCVVIYDRVLYPSVIGDVGPNYKTGEGSLRLCRQISPRADMNNRPVNDLKVTYLIFPGSGDKPWDAPNLDKWRTRCEQLLNDLGGYQGELFVWDDLTKPKPAPPVVPITSPSPAPTPGNTSTSAPASGAPP